MPKAEQATIIMYRFQHRALAFPEDSQKFSTVELPRLKTCESRNRSNPGTRPILGQAVAQAIGQGEHPLAHRHLRQEVVNEGGGVLRHSPPSPARAEAATLAREGHEPLERTGRTSQPREAYGEDPAAEEVTELVLDKGRQAVAVSAIRGGAQEGLPVLTNDGVEHGVLGVARPIREGRMCHALA